MPYGRVTPSGNPASAGRVIVTDRAVIAFRPEGPRLVSFHPGETVESVVAATGFEGKPGQTAVVPVDGGFISSAGVKYMSDTIKKFMAAQK